jgi:hypothetical protein
MAATQKAQPPFWERFKCREGAVSVPLVPVIRYHKQEFATDRTLMTRFTVPSARHHAHRVLFTSMANQHSILHFCGGEYMTALSLAAQTAEATGDAVRIGMGWSRTPMIEDLLGPTWREDVNRYWGAVPHPAFIDAERGSLGANIAKMTMASMWMRLRLSWAQPNRCLVSFWDTRHGQMRSIADWCTEHLFKGGVSGPFYYGWQTRCDPSTVWTSSGQVNHKQSDFVLHVAESHFDSRDGQITESYLDRKPSRPGWFVNPNSSNEVAETSYIFHKGRSRDRTHPVTELSITDMSDVGALMSDYTERSTSGMRGVAHPGFSRINVEAV